MWMAAGEGGEQIPTTTQRNEPKGFEIESQQHPSNSCKYHLIFLRLFFFLVSRKIKAKAFGFQTLFLNLFLPFKTPKSLCKLILKL
jgi:hypothetical protein